MDLLKRFVMIVFLIGLTWPVIAQEEARVYEEEMVLRTYPFSDPNPVANIGRIYPYFTFDGYTHSPRKQAWKFVILENKYIKVYITPEIGGKIWGAVEKSSGGDFIYFNKVVKFRNIAMRGPWTSGGIELNFGAIGHAPSCSTPVDYLLKKEADGSVSCTVGAMDLASRTVWRVTIRLPRDKAYFETHCLWTNPTPLNQSFYHWMNAAAEVSDDLIYIFPGSHYLSHGGRASPWPINAAGVDLSRYGNNTFGFHKSYHVMGSHDHFFAGYWLKRDFGFGHWSLHADKPGKKIWIWALSRQGEIWKDLLTDPGNNQYTEIQSGAMYSQANEYSTFTPFKHAFFSPHNQYQSSELWFPVKGIGGVSTASPAGALYIENKGKDLRINLCPLQPLEDVLVIKQGEREVVRQKVFLKPLEPLKIKVPALTGSDSLTIDLGRGKLAYSTTDKQKNTLHRPLTAPVAYPWDSAEGWFMKGEERARMRDFNGALSALQMCLKKEPFHGRAQARVGELYLRRGQPAKGLPYLKQALAIDTYHPAANYFYGIAHQQLGNYAEALTAFGWAARSMEYRSAAFYRMAMIYLKTGSLDRVDTFGQRSLDFDRFQLSAYRLLALSARLQRRKLRAEKFLARIRAIDPLSHFIRFETYLWQQTEENKKAFLDMIKNEFPEQSLMELALFYLNVGQNQTAIQVLRQAPKKPLVNLWLAYLYRQSDSRQSHQLLARIQHQTIRFVFPFRLETLKPLAWAVRITDHWKLKYYQALVFWDKGRLQDAAWRLDECGTAPGEYTFYLARGTLATQMEGRGLPGIAADFSRARSLAPDDWRCHHHLAQHYLQNSQPANALAAAQKALQRFKNHYIIRLDLAAALLANRGYQRCLRLLKDTRVLPYEGAREGRHLYHQANMLLAIQTMKQKKWHKTLQLCRQARLWPEHLGVGKPYDPDERLEDYITALVLHRQGETGPAGRYLQRVIEYTQSHMESSGPNHYLAVLALRRLGRQKQAGEMLVRWLKKFPQDKIAQWCRAHFSGKSIPAPKITPRSREFTLLLQLLK